MRSTYRTRPEARSAFACFVAFTVAVPLAGCGSTTPSPGSCTHYSGSARALENVPDCDLSGPHTLINGLPPAHPWNHS